MKNLPQEERTDTSLLQYLRSAIQDVEFAKTAQLASLTDKHPSFNKLHLSILTVAQHEDNLKTQTKKSTIYNNELDSDKDGCTNNNNEQVFDEYFIDRQLGIKPKRRPSKCGENKQENGSRNNMVLRCFNCNLNKHLAFHKERPGTNQAHEQKIWNFG